MSEQSAGYRGQRVGQADAKQLHPADIDTVGCGHCWIGACGAHGDSDSGRKKQVQSDFGERCKNTENDQVDCISRQSQAVEHIEHGMDAEQRLVWAAHDPQIDRIECDRNQNSAEDVENIETNVEVGRHEAGGESGECSRCRCGPGVPSERDDQDRGHRGAERKASLHRQIGEIEDAEAQKCTERHQSKNQTDLDRTDQLVERHGGYSTTLAARARTACGRVTPMAAADFLFTTTSKFGSF